MVKTYSKCNDDVELQKNRSLSTTLFLRLRPRITNRCSPCTWEMVFTSYLMANISRLQLILAQKRVEMPLCLENLNIFNDASTTGFFQAHLLMWSKIDLLRWSRSESRWSIIGPEWQSLSGMQIIAKLQWRLTGSKEMHKLGISKSTMWKSNNRVKLLQPLPQTSKCHRLDNLS